MRFRERTLPQPAGSTGVDCRETFSDDPNPLLKGVYKECTHTRVNVREASRGLIEFGHSSGWSTGYEFDAFSDFSTIGGLAHFREPLEEFELSLPKIDLQQMAFDRSRSSTNLAELASTFKDTLGLFSKPAAFCRHLDTIKGFKRGRKLQDSKDAINRAADTWLQGTYGYIPFISDLYNLSRECRNPMMTIARARIRARSSEKIRQSVSTTVRSQRFSVESFWNLYYSTTAQKTLTRVVQVDWVDNPSFGAMSAANKIATYYGLNDAGRLAYELIPYSFVADWFTNLGQRLSHIDSLNGPLMVSLGAVNAGVLTKSTEFSTSRHYGENPNWHVKKFVPATRTLVAEDYRRGPSSQEDLDGMVLSNGLNGYRTATGLALLLGPATRLFKLFRGKYT